jgi:protein SCO1
VRRSPRGLATLLAVAVVAAGAEPRRPLDAALVDEQGRAVHVYDDLIKGRAVAVNFIYTRCTSICLPMGGTFARVEALLGKTEDAKLISISLDPAGDTPEKLAEWKKRFGGGAGWTLLTGPKEEIDRLAKALGAFSPDRSLHSPTVIVLHEPSGRMVRVNGIGGAQAIVQALHDVAHPPETAKP